MFPSRKPHAMTFVALAGAAALALTGCGTDGSSDDQPVELAMWAWHANLQPAIDIWNESHPDIQIVLETLPADVATAYQKIFAGVKSGDAADILPVEYMSLPNFYTEEALADITDLAGDHQDAYQQAAWEQSQVDGNLYALPGDIGPLAMYYNAAALSRFGHEPPTTWEEFEQIGLDIKEQSGGTVYLGALQTSPNNFTALSWQAGARWWENNGRDWKVEIDSDETRMVAETWQRYIDQGIVYPWSNEDVGQQMVAEAAILTVINPSWWAPNLLGMDLPEGTFGVATLPQWEGSEAASANSGGSAWGVTASSQHTQQAVEFLTWFTQSEEAYSAINDDSSFSYPASVAQVKIAADRETPFTTVDGSDDVFSVFEQAAELVQTDWVWSPTTIATLTSVQDVLANLGPGGDLPGGVVDLQQKAVGQLGEQGFAVAT